VVTIGPSISCSLEPNPWTFGGAAEAGATAKTLAAAIAAAPTAVLAVVVVNFTMGSFNLFDVVRALPNGLLTH
jgi:hypothetical protein